MPAVRVLLAALALGVTAAVRAGEAPGAAPNPAEALEVPTITLIGTTPLPGLGTPIEDVPGNVQILTGESLTRGHALTDALERGAASVAANSAQGNPFQTDIAFRGFTASPLLGTPEGLSVFQDGVRINEPFGDVVNWDLVPRQAISSIQLIPGADPTFGLNTLGGALALYTKSGAQYPGATLETSGGSFGRSEVEGQWGASRGPLDAFVAASYFNDHGWAAHNPSHVRQLFAKLGWQDSRSDLDLSFTGANNSLQGTQTVPRSWLPDIRTAYTFPDVNEDRLGFATLKGSHFLNSSVLLGGNAYWRDARTHTFNSNVNPDYGATDPLTGAADTVPATNDLGRILTQAYGVGVQLSIDGQVAARRNQLMLGASEDVGHTRYAQYSQPADFTPDRGTLATGDFTPVTQASTSTHALGVFARDTLHVLPHWSATLSARFDRAEVRIGDLSGAAPQLTGRSRFQRVNPALGLNFNPHPRLTAYASYSEGMRAPTAIELTCADRNAPCKLPNEFLSDPPLHEVVSRTAEVGARGQLAGWVLSAAVYRSNLADDIQFISSSAAAANAGYFANIGATRREGLELSAAGRLGELALSLRYALVAATFRSAFSEESPAHSGADASGAIRVRPGDRLPGVPLHSLRLRLEHAAGARAALGLSVLANSGVYARGDESNSDVNGMVPGYVVLNADARWSLSGRLELFARIDNLLDRRYYNFAVLGQNFFTAPGRAFGPPAGFAPDDEQFRGPGVPIGAWIGVRCAVGGGAGGAQSADPD